MVLINRLKNLSRSRFRFSSTPRSSGGLDAILSGKVDREDVRHFSVQVDSLALKVSTTVKSSELNLYGEREDSWFTTARNPRLDPTFPGRHKLPNGKLQLASIAMPNLKTCTRAQVLDYFDNTWALTDTLFATLQGEEAFIAPPPHQLRHPLIFYYGHPTIFYINKLLVAGILKESLNRHFEEVFEVGVDEMRWDDMSKNEMTWPKVSQVFDYRKKVYQIVRQVIETHAGLDDGHEPITKEHPLWSLFMGFEHDRIHLETSSVLIQEHPPKFFKRDKLLPFYFHERENKAKVGASNSTNKAPMEGVDYPKNQMIKVQGGMVQIGKPDDFPSFGWDNEYGRRQIDVPSFQASAQLISNGEFYEFVSSGGYRNPKYWSSTGWQWKCFKNNKQPSFWVQNGPSGSHRYRLRAIFDVLPMQWDWPVQVNWHEAKAFCRWRNERDQNQKTHCYHLTTEPMHHLLREKSDQSQHAASDAILNLPANKTMYEYCQRNTNLSFTSFSPVNAMQPNEKGFYDVFGNAWEWCEDHFSPLPGFNVHPYYDDFSSPCFDGEHQIIMGGSFMSSGNNGGSLFARYHFRPHFFQHASFRLISQEMNQRDRTIRLATSCVNAPGPHAKPAPYRDTEKVVCEE